MSDLTHTGLIHIYMGNGKGKTTAACGLCVRAAGRDKKVIFAQFLKTQDTGELNSFEKLGITVIRSTVRLGFTNTMNDRAKSLCGKEQEKIMKEILNLLSREKTDLLVLDEVLDAVSINMLDETELRSLIANKPADLEIVLTGRNPPAWLAETADYISDVGKVKHPYDRGVKARIGIEQ
ncbi:MAG: cob(I)yrinic acid a,c-diamide adenosyltransferase [Treponema sp.]|jgi:cob(I)alamin adenosyltransferase|nr:cob(I)yrinic acid a,c-diamide adenosyltransferase [Treponema sp.]